MLLSFGCDTREATTQSISTSATSASPSITNNTPSADSTPITEKFSCFLFVEGVKNADSSFVKLIIMGDEVMGEKYRRVHGVDRAFGAFTGRINGGTIHCLFHNELEGSPEIEIIAMKLENDELYEKVSESTDITNGDSGSEDIDIEPAKGGWSGPYKKVDCK